MFWSPDAQERSFEDYYILTLILSAMQWRKTNPGKLTFYGDPYTIEYLEKNKLCPLWSVCDSQTLDREIDKKNYDIRTFFTIGKFIALQKEPIPCALIDTDLIIWENLKPLLKNAQCVFTHWEKPDYSADPPMYLLPEKLNIRSGYRFHKKWKFSLNAANTSFIYFNNNKLKQHYVDCAFDYMWRNFIPSHPYKNHSALLFVEQQLLTLCCKEMGAFHKTYPLLDILWDLSKGYFVPGKTLPQGWPFFELDNNSIATHTWIAKSAIQSNQAYRTYMCCRAIEKILDLDGTMYDVLSRIDSLQKHIELLEKYKTAHKIVLAGIGSKILYQDE